NFNSEAFIAVIPTIVPEPAAGALALLGLICILLLRRCSLWRPNKFSSFKTPAADDSPARKLLSGHARPAPLILRAAERGRLRSVLEPFERSNPMRNLKLFRWTAALMVAIVLMAAAASAQADGTITISGTFSMDYLSGERDLDLYLPGLAEVYFNGHEHT